MFLTQWKSTFLHKCLMSGEYFFSFLGFLALIIHRISVLTKDDAIISSWETETGFCESKTEEQQYFSQHQVSKAACFSFWCFLFFFFFHLTRTPVLYWEKWFSSMSGFHSNTNCLTAALQGLFSAAGSSLTPVCQGGVMEGEYDPAHSGMQHHNFSLFLFAKKVLKAWAWASSHFLGGG